MSTAYDLRRLVQTLADVEALMWVSRKGTRPSRVRGMNSGRADPVDDFLGVAGGDADLNQLVNLVAEAALERRLIYILVARLSFGLQY
jgi:hypothetical protein